MDLNRDDLVEHWEDGIGKVVEVDEGSITIDFQIRGEIKLPRGKTGFLQRLDPQGLWAQYLDNPDRVKSLVNEEPEEAIKLLIRDVDTQAKRIDRTRLKSLLTKGEPNSIGWRQNFTLVEDWDAWWKIAAKRLKKDPWIDSSDKTAIILRQEAISEIQVLQKKFLKEKEPGKKIIIAEQLLKVCDKADHEIILNDIRDFINVLLQSSENGPYLGQAVYNATYLRKKGVQIPYFDDREYDLSLRALLLGKLTPQRLPLIYHLFSNLPNQNPNDHLILFLYGNEKLREEIVKTFKKKNGLVKKTQPEVDEEALTPIQATLLSRLEITTGELTNKDAAKVLASIPGTFIANFFLAVLLSPGICESVKRAVAASIIEREMHQTVYQYFIKVDPNLLGPEIQFLHEFLKAIGPTNAEWALKTILLTGVNANQKPAVFLTAFKDLVSDSDPILSREQKGLLLSTVSKLLSTGLATIDQDLLMQISNLAATVPGYEVLSGSLSNEDVVDIAKNHQSGIRRRIEAIGLLATRGLVEMGRALAQELCHTIERDEFVLLQELLKSFPDTHFVKYVLRLFLERIDTYDSELLRAFADVLRTAKVNHSFCELILSDEDKEWHEKHRKRVETLLQQDESLVKDTVRFGLEKILAEDEPPNNLKNSFVLYLAPFMNKVIDEVKIMAIEKVRALKAALENLSTQHDEELVARASDFELRLDEATTRISQRYNQYLKRLVPISGQIRQIQEDLDASAPPCKDINDRLSVIREDIEVLLKILKVTDIKQS